MSFNRDIRPILADKCFKCHGPDARRAERQAAARQCQRRAAPAASGSAAIVPGKLDESELYQRITSTDPDERMPPPKSGKTLSAAEVAKLKTWIEEGAEYQGHWAFLAPERPPLPSVKNAAWCRNPIDRFILARLEAEGLTPSPEADKVTLIRRLSLDLIGLPPSIPRRSTPFWPTRRADAYERLVDRLLASPHYGERWGRLWLDAARYADSDGYEKDKSRHVWFYRDWVINAFNRDLPYDQFIIEQIAGDQLPGRDPGPDRRHRLPAQLDDQRGRGHRSRAVPDGGDVRPDGRHRQGHPRPDDPVRPVPQPQVRPADAGRVLPAVRLPEQRPRGERRGLHARGADEDGRRSAARSARSKSRLRHHNPDWAGADGRVGKAGRGRPARVGRSCGRRSRKTRPAARSIMPHGRRLVPGPGLRPDQAHGQDVGEDRPHADHGVPPGAAERPEPAAGRPRPVDQGDGGPDRVSASRPRPRMGRGKPIAVKFSRATADVNPPETPLEPIFDDKSGKKRVTGPVGFAIDGKDETAWGIDAGPGRRNQPRKAVFAAEKPIAFPGGHDPDVPPRRRTTAAGTATTTRTTTSAGSASRSRPRPTPRPTRSRSASARSWPSRASNGPPPRRPPSSATGGRPSPSGRRPTPGSSRSGSSIPRARRNWRSRNATRGAPTHLLQRGDFLKPGKPVAPGVPAFLHPLPPGAPPTRLTFARWLVDRKSPTTARSLVNRVWQAYFGTGLVATSEDLGPQGEPPSHPELLDWLAVEFMDRGWSLKHLHRLIVTSAAYRQSSRPTPELLARDPYNRLLARGPRFRVDAEIVRDIALAASGLLDPKLGGPSVCPPAPAFLFQPPASYGPKVWNEATGPDRYRRALYTFRCRSVPYPMLQTFDAPNGDFSCVRRTRSNTPLQALTTLNEPIFLECARALALRTLDRRRAHRRRSPGLRLPPLPGAPPDRAGDRGASRPAAPPDAAVRAAGSQSLGPGGQRPGQTAATARRRDPAAARRLDGRRRGCC